MSEPVSPESVERSARGMALAMLGLMGVGVVMVASASVVPELREGRSLVLLRGHLLRIVVAIAAFLLASRLRPRHLYHAALPLWLVAVGMLGAVLVTGVTVNGARRWLDLGIMTFQPSELARVAVVVAIGAWAATARDRMGGFCRGTLVPFVLAGIPAVLVLLEPDFGSSVYLLFMGVLVMWVGGGQVRHLFLTFLATLGAASLYGWERLAHVSRRVSSFHEPEAGSQVWQGLVALGRGGETGVGLGGGMSGWGYVPEVENDFILAAVGEELGLLGTLLVVGLYVVFLYHGLRLLLGMRTRFGLVVGSGLLFQVLVQALLNLAVVTAMAPPKGLPLPFVSAGGSSLLVLSISTGLLLGLARSREQDRWVDTRWVATLAGRAP